MWHFTLAARLLHLPRGFYTYRATFALTARLLHLPRGFCTCCAAFTLAMQLLHFAAQLLYLPHGFFNAVAGDPSRPPYYCISLCVQLVTYCAKQKKPLECKFWHILPAYFTTLMNFKNDIFDFNTTQAKHLYKNQH